jgi:hypothetical protein
MVSSGKFRSQVSYGAGWGKWGGNILPKEVEGLKGISFEGGNKAPLFFCLGYYAHR